MSGCYECGTLDEEYLYDGICVSCMQKEIAQLTAQLATANEEAKAGRSLWKEAQAGRKRVVLELDKVNEENERLRGYIRMVGRYAHAQYGDIKADAHSELYQIATLCRDELVEQDLKEINP